MSMRPREFLAGAITTLAFVLGSVALWPARAQAEIFGSVHGIVHDPQHRPVPGADVDLKAQHSDWMQHQKTNDSGEFDFGAVPIGEYTVTVSLTNFQTAQQAVVVMSGASPVLHIP